MRYAVTGIGINVNHGQFPDDLGDTATSLRLESDRLVSRQDLAIAVLRAFDEELTALMAPANFPEATAQILKRIEKKSSWIRGKRVLVDEAEGYTGVTAGLDPLGFLRVKTESGIRTVLSGGVRARKG